MKPFAALLIFSAFLGFGQHLETVNIHSRVLNQERQLLIYTPYEFLANPEETFETIYVFDAQNRALFDLVHASLEFYATPNTNHVVVGVVSPPLDDPNWSRNMDMLPKANHKKTTLRYEGRLGKADAFLDFLQKEVIPYIESNYRAGTKKIAVGHSNSATLLIHSLLVRPNLFDHSIAISPNLAFDDEQMVTRLRAFDPTNLERKKFLYVSNADESTTTGWEGWKVAREKAYGILQNWNAKNMDIQIQRFPQESHWSTYPLGVIYGLKRYFEFVLQMEATND